MGQKINPIGLRLTVNKTWDSRWFADKNYSAQLLEDLKIREYVERELKKASISKVIIERVAKKVNVIIFTSQPGMIIGKKGADIDNLKKTLTKLAKKEVSVKWKI